MQALGQVSDFRRLFAPDPSFRAAFKVNNLNPSVKTCVARNGPNISTDVDGNLWLKPFLSHDSTPHLSFVLLSGAIQANPSCRLRVSDEHSQQAPRHERSPRNIPYLDEKMIEVTHLLPSRTTTEGVARC